MDTSKPYNSPLTAALDFFGVREGQTKLQFGQEWKELSPESKKEITDGLVKQGYQIQSALGT